MYFLIKDIVSNVKLFKTPIMVTKPPIMAKICINLIPK